MRTIVIIILGVAPFKVMDRGIERVLILMINLGKIGWIRNEGLGYEAMNQSVLTMIVNPKLNTWITHIIKPLLYNLLANSDWNTILSNLYSSARSNFAH